MAKIVIYTKSYCGFCWQAKALLHARGAAFEEIDVTDDRDLQLEMIERSRRRTVPQIFIDDRHIGGSDELAALERRGGLDVLLGRQPPESAGPRPVAEGLVARARGFLGLGTAGN